MDLNTLTFGVEIETMVPAGVLNSEGWVIGGYHAGRSIPGFTGWQAATDGSIMAPVGYRGVEVVSPVLRGIEGLNEISRMVAKLKAMGAKVNQSTGFHVHVGFEASNTDALIRLIHLTANVEPGLFASTGSQARRGNRFCKSIKQGFEDAKRLPPSCDTVHKLAQRVSAAADRYHVLNVTNLLSGRRPTVEFRVFAGTLNATKMRAYVQLCLGLVQLAVEYPKKSRWDVAPRPYVLSGGTGESEVKRLFIVLGWSRNRSLFYGPHRDFILSRGTTGEFKQFGLLDEAGLPAMKKLLVQLGRKFDGGPRRATDVVVDD